MGVTAVFMLTAWTADLRARLVITAFAITRLSLVAVSSRQYCVQGPTIDITDLVFDTLGQEAKFGSHNMSEQSDYRKAAFDDLIDKCAKGTKVGNSYLQSFLKHGIEEYKFADFLHTLPGKGAFPLSRSITVSIRIQTHHFQFGDRPFSSIASIMT